MHFPTANVKNMVSVRANRGLLLLQKYSPEIYLGLGITGFGLTTYLACRATIKSQEPYETFKKTIEYLEESDEVTDAKEYKRAKTLALTEFIFEVIKLYGPAVAIGVLSIGLLVGSHRVLSGRNAALVAAYEAVDRAYKEYRKRVKDELGEDVDKYFRFKKRSESKMKIVDKDEKEIKFDEMEVDLPGEIVDELGMPSPYAKFFDETNIQFRNDNDQNVFFLRTQQIYANQRLHSVGHLFLNEVYDMLSIDRTPAGAIVGWVRGGRGDNVVDFDIDNPYNTRHSDYVNDPDGKSLLIDFNVDGPIWNRI